MRFICKRTQKISTVLAVVVLFSTIAIGIISAITSPSVVNALSATAGNGGNGGNGGTGGTSGDATSTGGGLTPSVLSMIPSLGELTGGGSATSSSGSANGGQAGNGGNGGNAFAICVVSVCN
jgi:hypothetical protein